MASSSRAKIGLPNLMLNIHRRQNELKNRPEGLCKLVLRLRVQRLLMATKPSSCSPTCSCIALQLVFPHACIYYTKAKFEDSYSFALVLRLSLSPELIMLKERLYISIKVFSQAPAMVCMPPGDQHMLDRNQSISYSGKNEKTFKTSNNCKATR